MRFLTWEIDHKKFSRSDATAPRKNRCAVAPLRENQNSSARESEFIQSQLNQSLDLSRAIDICRHIFADRIVDVDFSAETVRLAFDFRQHLDDGFTMRLSHAKNQLRLRRQFRRQVSCR